MSSLFGNTPSEQTGGLFGHAQSQAAGSNTGKSLFDSVEAPLQSQPQQGSSIFSAPATKSESKPFAFPSFPPTTAAQQQSSAPATSSLFAPAASQPQQTSSLFQQPQNSSLFGQPPTSQPAASSLFSTQPQVQVDQQQEQTNAQQGLAASKAPAYFDNLIEKGKKRNRDGERGSSFSELPRLELELGDIAKRVRQIGGAAAPHGDKSQHDSRAHYLLAASGINPGTTRRDLDALAAQPGTASNLTQTSDWDPDNGKYMQQLEQRLTTRMVNEALERSQRRFNAFLEENVDINWEKQRKRIYDHFGLTPRDSDDIDDFGGSTGKGSFGHSTRRGRGSKTNTQTRSTMNRSVFGQSSLQKSVIGTPGSEANNATIFADISENTAPAAIGPADRYLREKQRRYAEKVQGLNLSRLRRAKKRDGTRQEEPLYPVVDAFLTVETEGGGDTPKQIVDAYKALKEIVREGQTGERHFAGDYLEEMPNSARAIKIRKQILDGSRKSLEKVFFDSLESLVEKNPREANLGGIPTALSKVRAYVRIRAGRKDLAPDGYELAMMGEDYCWALVFYLLRCGLVKEAAEYVVNSAAHFKTIDRNIITFLTAFARSPERRLDGRVQRDCNNVYSSMTKVAPGDTVDPYRIACYKIIGRCDLGRRNLDKLSQGVDDWIWLQFNLAREVDRAEESAGDVFGLEEVRETISEIGQRHFQRGAEGLGGFGTFFHLQILGGMFERAVSYLYSYSYTAAVHFAIVLDYYGLLRVTDFAVSDADLLTYNTKQLPQVGFGRMIGYYTRDFRAANVEAAVDYLALLCLNADLPGRLGKSQAELCHEALRELVLETREFAQLLGDINSRGDRIKGVIENRLEILALQNQDDYMKTITIQAASVADDNGRIADAVLLYHLAEDYDNVIEILNRSLSDAQSVDLVAEPARLQPLKPRSAVGQEQQQNAGSSLSLTSVDDPYVLAENMYHLYKTGTRQYWANIKPGSRETLEVLLRLSQARAMVIAGKYSEAYELIHTLHLLPLTAHAHIPTIRSAAANFNTLPAPISRNIGPILLWTITCISKQRDMISKRNYEGASGGELDKELSGAARDLMVFAGLVKYRLGERVWEGVTAVAGDVGGL